ncbi:MAG: TetR/AcrR family transcriptional regulator [Gammaproteobacteria bacterium]|nr:MAG: TetR/AcrR family transcriptional regulator [Gammaproteobacteria bacterium]
MTSTTAPLGRRDQNRVRNRKAILDAALACFLEKPYSEVSVRDIIRRTDLAAGTFYNYFTDKASVFRSLVNDYLNRLNHEMHDIRASATTLPEMIGRTYRALFRTVRDNPALFEIIRQNESAIRNLCQADIMGLTHDSLLRDLKDAQARGLISGGVDVEYLAACFFGVGYEMGIAFARRASACPEQAAEFAVALFMHGVNGLATD